MAGNVRDSQTQGIFSYLAFSCKSKLAGHNFPADPLSILDPADPYGVDTVRDYDALMYHLQVPRLFLEHGSYFFDPELYRLSYPSLTEMLFLVGIAFDVDIFSQWISLTYAIIFFLSVYAYGKRFFTPEVGLLAVCILAGNPAFPTYAASPAMIFRGHVTTSGAYLPCQFGLR